MEARMTPEMALARQIELYQKMSGQERLQIALELHELACDVAREGVRRQHPDADQAQVERHLRQRLELGRR
jgi:hypothetical protein